MKSASIAIATLAVASAVNIDRRREPLLTWSPTPKKSGHPVDYFVPHFGEDHDIIETKKSWATEEKKQGHFWAIAPPADDPPRNYFVPHFGTDEDIKSSLKNLNDQEAKHRKWNLPPDEWFAQIDNRPEEHEQLQLESDPICSSAGCVQYLHKVKGLGYKINYPVPNFGADTDIIDSKASLDLAEKMQQHQLDLPNKKWRKPKFVKYPYEDPLDEDAIDTMKNLADAEKELGHKWEI